MSQSLRIFVLFIVGSRIAVAQSPYKNYGSADNIFLGLTALGGLTQLYLEHNMAPLTSEQAAALNRNDVNRFDRPATFNLSEHSANMSDYGMYVSLLMPLGLLADAKIRDESQKLAYLYLETMAITGVLTELTKVTVQRIRPWAYNENVPLASKEGIDVKKSFFSGHTSASFAGAVLFAKVFSDYNPDSKWKPYIWAGSMALASAVGYWRVQAGRHFPTDVIFGALIGGGAAYLIPELHKADHSNLSLSIPPSQPLAIGLSFSF